MSVNLTANFLSNARGITLLDGGGITWSINKNTNAITATGGGGASPVTTKGDLYGFSTVAARVPVGTDGYALVADSTQATGLRWVFAPAVSIPVPGTIPDLATWMASDSVLASAGYPVSRIKELLPSVGGISWYNNSGSAASQATVDTATLNGLPLLKFSANLVFVLQALNTTFIGTNATTPGATFFVVIKPVALVGATLNTICGSPANGLAFYLNSTASTQKIGLVKTSVAVIGTATNAWVVGTAFQANATYDATTGAFAFRQGRAANGSGTGTTGAKGVLSSLGADNGANFLTGHSLAELIVYNRILTGPEITAVENYLFAKWGV